MAHCYRALPGFDYILTQISTAQQHDILLNKFIRVSLRKNHFLREDLYVFHVAALIRSDDIEFSAGAVNDLNPVRDFLEGKADSHILLPAFQNAVHYHTDLDVLKLNCTVFRVDGVVIGFAIFAHETDMDYLIAQYSVDDFIYGSLHDELAHLRLIHFIINPIFNYFRQYILKEMMRMNGASSMFHRFYPLPAQEDRKDTLICCLDLLNLVRPRKVLEYSNNANWRLIPSPLARDHQEAFALYNTNRRLLFNVKQPVVSRIVVLGASDTSLQVGYLKNG